MLHTNIHNTQDHWWMHWNTAHRSWGALVHNTQKYWSKSLHNTHKYRWTATQMTKVLAYSLEVILEGVNVGCAGAKGQF